MVNSMADVGKKNMQPSLAAWFRETRDKGSLASKS